MRTPEQLKGAIRFHAQIDAWATQADSVSFSAIL